ncbi:cyclic nucleotide-binding domain-containing protein [Streptomyces sp. NPDC047315]|uniref:cyclic nucleotide-binding domain-containing protein n=1 Tax=Streptomyces sp. NPDC047315 TaxID=3155142 RepID=UPI00340D7337
MRTGFLAALPADRYQGVTDLSRKVSFRAGSRIFEEGEPADRFWVVGTGKVVLDVQVPGRGPVLIETIGAGELLGWSWLCPPRQWHLGSRAVTDVQALEFDAEAVMRLCEGDPALDHAVLLHVVEVVGERLRAARTRLLDLYGSPEER